MQPSWWQGNGRVDRRGFMRQVALGLSVSLLAACGPAAPPARPTSGPAATGAATQATSGTAAAGSGAVVSRTGRVPLPTYVPPNWPAPDVPGGAITPPGFTSYPQQLIRSVPTPPG